MLQVTISLKDEENEVIERLMASLHLKRHQVIKLAIRRFLFPTEESNIPLNGKYAHSVGFTRPISKHPEEFARKGYEITEKAITIVKDDDEPEHEYLRRKIQQLKDSEKKLTITKDKDEE